MLNQLAERSSRIHLCAQCERADEHADQIIEGTISPAGDRRADHDVVGAAQTCQQERERCMHSHECSGLLLPRHVSDTAVKITADREVNPRAVKTLLRRPVSIERKFQEVGST